MQIFYYQRRDHQTNFGDELNTWLWHRLLPEVISQGNDAILVGLGTLLNNLLPSRLGKTCDVFIFSTGVGYEKRLRSIPQRWKLYCVRGPLSAKHLNLPAELALTDGGILLRRLVPSGPCQTPTVPAAFMPHVHHASFAGEAWKSICQTAGLRYIDPRWPVEQVITAIQTSQLLLAEAMHGAITADALGVPWIPVTTSPRILSFKWQDWCASIHQPYHPVVLPPLVPNYPRYGRGVRSGIRASIHWGRAFVQHPWNLPVAKSERIASVLEHTVQEWAPVLSDRTHLENLTQALEYKLAQLRQDALKLQDRPNASP